MLARLGKTLSTNAAIGGLTLLVLGAGGAGTTLTSGSSTPKPDKSEKSQKAEKAEKAEKADEGVRPTDTHGYCVSQVARTKPTAPTGTGPDKVNHGSLVREAAHACGKQEKASKSDKASKPGKPGKAHGRGHGKGRPSTVTPGTPAS